MAPSFPEQPAELHVTTGKKIKNLHVLGEVCKQFLIKRRCGIQRRVKRGVVLKTLLFRSEPFARGQTLHRR